MVQDIVPDEDGRARRRGAAGAPRRWCEAEGTVTVERAPRAARARGARPAGRRATTSRSSFDLGAPHGPRPGRSRQPSRCGTSSRTLVAVARRHELRAARGAGRPAVARAPTRAIPASPSCTAACGSEPIAGRARRSTPVEHEPPVDALDDEFPIRLTDRPAARLVQHRRADGGYTSPLRRGETVDIYRRRTATRSASREGERVRVVLAARRGRWRPCASTERLRPGLAFMTLHFPGRGRRPTCSPSTRPIRSRAPPSSRRRRSAIERLCRLDLRPASPSGRPTPSERAAVDAAAGRRDGRHAQPRASGDAITCAAGTPRRARRHGCCRALHAAQARAGWISAGALELHLRAADSAARRGATVSRRFYALLAARSRGRPVVVHVCDDIACRANAPRAASGRSNAEFVQAGTARRRRAWLPQPVPRPVRAGAGGVLVQRAGERRARRRTLHGASETPSPRRSRASPIGSTARRAEPRSGAALGSAAIALCACSRRVGVVDPTSLDDYRAHGGYAAPSTRALEHRPGRRHRAR